MKKRLLSLALCLVLVVGLFSGLTVNASASKIDDLKKEIPKNSSKRRSSSSRRSLRSPIGHGCDPQQLWHRGHLGRLR